jgi:signal transduction histidine kinase/ActR/RegA family two-component response regulator
MSERDDDDHDDQRLRRCVRDLAALNALPSMCIGRSPDEALEIVLDALPTALSCQLIYLLVPSAGPGASPKERASLHGAAFREETTELQQLRSLLANGKRPNEEEDETLDVPGVGKVWLLDVEMTMGGGGGGSKQGRLVAGRTEPFDAETDRVLVRSAANLVATSLENANVLDAARRKDEFLAILGHELRNPLAPIHTAVELLARHPNAAREQQIIERHSRHLARLVDDLLDISRVTRGHVELRNERVTLASVLERAIEIAGPLITRQRQSLTVDATDDIALRGDPVRLAQIFGNLLANSAKFTMAGGRIDILIDKSSSSSSSSEQDHVRVTVRDNGRGIPREQQARIFEPFVQAEREQDALRGGLGLGLAIVSSLVERHGGSIEVHSEGRGRGSTFTVELPIDAGPESPVVVKPPQGPAARADIRVLVVDDNEDLADLLSEALTIAGFKTAIAHDAYAALERWRSFEPHAAVLDVGLPELDGYELAKTLRKEHGSQPTLIAATGYGQRQDKLKSADAGFDCHFVKPVSTQDLIMVLDERVVRAASTKTKPS